MEGSEESAKNDYASYDEYPDLQQIARERMSMSRVDRLINVGTVGIYGFCRTGAK